MVSGGKAIRKSLLSNSKNLMVQTCKEGEEGWEEGARQSLSTGVCAASVLGIQPAGSSATQAMFFGYITAPKSMLPCTTENVTKTAR